MSHSIWKCEMCGLVLVDAKVSEVKAHKDKHMYSAIIIKDHTRKPTHPKRRKK